MNSTWIIIVTPIILFVLCIIVAFFVNIRFRENEYQAECKLIDINNLLNLKNNNSDEFIKEAEFILKYLKNKSYSEFYDIRYSKSRHNNGYYLVAYTSRINSKRCFPCSNIMGNYGYPDYYLKDMDEVRAYYIDLLWRELSYMNKERKKFAEYNERREF